MQALAWWRSKSGTGAIIRIFRCSPCRWGIPQSALQGSGRSPAAPPAYGMPYLWLMALIAMAGLQILWWDGGAGLNLLVAGILPPICGDGAFALPLLSEINR